VVWQNFTDLLSYLFIYPVDKSSIFSMYFLRNFQPHFSWFTLEMFCKWFLNKMVLWHALTTLCVTHIANWQPYYYSTDVLVWVALHNQAYVFLCSNQKLKRRLVFLRDDVLGDFAKRFLGGFSWTVDTELPRIHDVVYVSVYRSLSQKYICWLKCSNCQNLGPIPMQMLWKLNNTCNRDLCWQDRSQSMLKLK
jgi:hypothetical protein